MTGLGDTDLPSNWTLATLEQIATWGSGGTPKSGNPKYYGGTIPWIVIGDLNDGPINSSTQSITEEGLATSSAKWVPENAVLIAMYGSIGKLGITKRPVTTNQAIAFAIPHSEIIDTRYLFWYLRSQRESLAQAGRGGTQQNISQSILKSWPIPVPPLAEQHRIAETLEDHLSHLDAAITDLRKSIERLPALRGGIRNSVTGHRKSSELPAGWSWGQLSDVLSRIEAGKSFRCEARPATGVEWGVIKVSAMTWGEFRPQEQKAVPELKQVDPRHEIKPGDILVSRANTSTYVGAPVLVKECRAKLLLSDKSLRLIPRPGVDKTWLIHVLSSPHVRSQISTKATGTKDSMRNITQRDLLSVHILIPPEYTQQKIAETLECEIDRIENLYAELKITHLRAKQLRNALLTRAFSGKLVSQDPNDEPASALLNRLRAVRAPKKSSSFTGTPPRTAPISTSAAGTQEELPL